MSVDTDPSVADRQRNRAFRRGNDGGARPGRVDPPRQRRPALAALAVLLIVGGALVAGLLAIRMDSREPVLAAARDIAAGTQITPEDLREVDVSAADVPVIPSDLAGQVLDGATYADVPIDAGSLIDQNMLTKEVPVGEDRAEVSVPLDPTRTPGSALQSGDLVQVVRVSGEEAATEPEVLTEGLVLATQSASADDLGSVQTGTVRLLVPTEVAAAVVDAAGSGQAGLALIERGQPTDADLQVGGDAGLGADLGDGGGDGGDGSDREDGS